MKIRGWHVDRAGALRDHDVRDLPDGLTIVCGPNGSGKSTVFAFLERALFGGSAAHLAARRSPRGEGRIWCAGPAGDVTIVQSGDPSAPPRAERGDGQDAGEADIEACFGGADYRLLGSLMAFNVDDLRAPLARLLSALRHGSSRAGAERLLDHIRQALESTRERLQALRERSADAQALLDSPAELDTAINRARRATEQCRHVLCAQARTRRAIESLAGDVAALEAERSTCDTLIDLAPLWQAFTDAREELSRLEPPPALPVDVEERLASALAPQPAPPAPDRATALQSPAEGLLAWQHRLKNVVESVRNREAELDATKRRLVELDVERDTIQSTIGFEPPSLASLDEGRRLIERVRASLAGIAEENAFTRRLQDRIAECGDTIRNLEANPLRQPSRIVLYGGWLGALTGTSTLAWWPPVGHALESGAVIAFSLVSLVGAIVERSRRTAFLAADLERRARLVALRTDLQDACHQLLTHQERGARRRYDVGVDSTRLGLRALPSERQLQVLERDLLERRQQRQTWEAAQSALVRLQTARDESRAREREQAQAALEAQSLQKQAIEEWQEWKARTGLAEHVDAGRSAAQLALAQLCADAGVQDESSLRERIAARRQHQDAQRTTAECEVRLHERLPRDQAANVLQSLAEGTVEKWRERAAHAAEALADRQIAREAALRQLQAIDKQTCALVDQAARLPKLEVELDVLRTEALDAVREEHALATTASLLAAVQKRAERLCQPPAVLSASRRFFAITGRYDLTLPSDPGRTLSVMDARGGERSLDQLSRTTLDQLQFSLRLGVADELTRRGVCLPLLIDDVIDNGDSVRRRTMAEQVVDVSRGRQVFVFTSRPETADLLRRLDPAAHTVAMHEL